MNTAKSQNSTVNPIGSGAPGSGSREWQIRLGVAFLASVVAAILGPFSTYDHFSFLERLFYWGGLIMGLVVPAYFLRAFLYRYLTGSSLRRDLIAAALLSVVIGLVVWLFNTRVMGFDLIAVRFLVEHIAIVLLFCLASVSIRAYLRQSLVDLRAHHAENAPAPLPVPEPVVSEGQEVFLRRLDPDKRGVLLHVSAADHHLQVWTDKGGSKVRLRFSDALKELTEFEGTRVHRSHWVATKQIKSVVPDGRRHIVELSCGGRVPVSQNGLRALRDEGVAIDTAGETRANG